MSHCSPLTDQLVDTMHIVNQQFSRMNWAPLRVRTLPDSRYVPLFSARTIFEARQAYDHPHLSTTILQQPMVYPCPQAAWCCPRPCVLPWDKPILNSHQLVSSPPRNSSGRTRRCTQRSRSPATLRKKYHRETRIYGLKPLKTPVSR